MADHDIRMSLINCITARDFEGVQKLILDLPLPRVSSRFNWYPRDPVCTAVEAEDDAIFNLLLLSGFDPDKHTSPHNTEGVVQLKPLHIAACRGNVRFAKMLIEKYNVPVDSLDNKGKTPLMWAVYRKRTVLVEYLISQGADVNHADSSGVTPLFLAVSKTHSVEIMKMLLDAGSDLNVKVRSRCLLYKAAVIGRLDMAKLLHSHGHRLDAECAELWSKRDIQLIKFLIEINAPQGDPADMDLVSKYQGPLCASSAEETDQWLELLIETGHFICVIDWDKMFDETMEKSFEKLKLKLRYHMCNPKSLQQLCVIRIRSILGLSLPKDVDSLPLPLMLRKQVRREHLYK